MSRVVDPEQLAEHVKREFLHAWEGYVRYAWGHDDLRPLSKSFRDWYAQPLLMTPVDSLDTMLLMGLDEEAEKAMTLIVETLSFDKDISVSNFEITIRLIGGLLSSFQLTNDRALLALAEDLGTRLLPAFESPTGITGSPVASTFRRARSVLGSRPTTVAASSRPSARLTWIPVASSTTWLLVTM